MRFYGKGWGSFTATGWTTTTGRIIIGCIQDDGHSYGITVSRWISERRDGGIVPERRPASDESRDDVNERAEFARRVNRAMRRN